MPVPSKYQNPDPIASLCGCSISVGSFCAFPQSVNPRQLWSPLVNLGQPDQGSQRSWRFLPSGEPEHGKPNIILTTNSPELKAELLFCRRGPLHSRLHVNIRPLTSNPIQLRGVSRIFDGGVEAVRAMDLDIAAGRIPGDDRAERVREIDAAADHRGAGPARPPGTIAGVDPRADRVRLPGCASAALAERAAERGAAAGAARRRRQTSGSTRAMSAIEQVGLADAISAIRPSSPAGCGCAFRWRARW